jgi:PAS domain-containing protein
MTSDNLKDRLASLLFRLGSIERRANAGGQSPPLSSRLLADLRTLTGELDRTAADVWRLLERCDRLETARADAASRAERLMEMLPVACLFTDEAGTITESNLEAVKLLNVSRRHLIGRPFHLYLSSDRDAFLRQLASLAGDGPQAVAHVSVRPRERAAFAAALTLALDPGGGVIVMIRPQGASHTVSGRAVRNGDSRSPSRVA